MSLFALTNEALGNLLVCSTPSVLKSSAIIKKALSGPPIVLGATAKLDSSAYRESGCERTQWQVRLTGQGIMPLPNGLWPPGNTKDWLVLFHGRVGIVGTFSLESFSRVTGTGMNDLYRDLGRHDEILCNQVGTTPTLLKS